VASEGLQNSTDWGKLIAAKQMIFPAIGRI